MQLLYLAISSMETADDRHLVASQPVIALIFQILPPLFVSSASVLEELEPAITISLAIVKFKRDKHAQLREAFTQKHEILLVATSLRSFLKLQ